MPRRYFIKTFGCQMNEYDSARMADVLRAGADLMATDDPLEADLLLMNTCSVREKAQEKVFSLLGEWRLPKAPLPQQRERTGEQTAELQSPCNFGCRLLLEKKKPGATETIVSSCTLNPSALTFCDVRTR